MLVKKYRLDRLSFWKTKQTGSLVKSQLFSGYWLVNLLPHSRFSVVVSTNISKKAVIRNRLRRRIYNLLGQMTLESQVDVIMYVKTSVLKLTDAEISSGLLAFLSPTA